jgi:hypothetical protein
VIARRPGRHDRTMLELGGRPSAAPSCGMKLLPPVARRVGRAAVGSCRDRRRGPVARRGGSGPGRAPPRHCARRSSGSGSCGSRRRTACC